MMTMNELKLEGPTMMTATCEPPRLEIRLTLGLGLTVLSPYYRSFANSLQLRGGERVLDFGSGSGVCSRHIAARLQGGGWLDCVDISRGWQAVIRRTLRRCRNVGYHLGHITQLDLPQAAYDVVVIHFVLHDIPAADRPAVMSALAARLIPGGRLLLREPRGHGLTAPDIHCLAEHAGLAVQSIDCKDIALLRVYDGCLIR
jgi:SAM-dependent methyltransferase